MFVNSDDKSVYPELSLRTGAQEVYAILGYVQVPIGHVMSITEILNLKISKHTILSSRQLSTEMGRQKQMCMLAKASAMLQGSRVVQKSCACNLGILYIFECGDWRAMCNFGFVQAGRVSRQSRLHPKRV